MPIKKHGIIIETPTEARQAEPGPSMLTVLTISMSCGVDRWRRLVGVLPNLTDRTKGNRHAMTRRFRW
jgi:hypothetical protein